MGGQKKGPRGTKTHDAVSANTLGYNYRVCWYMLYAAFWGGFLHITIGYDVGVAGGLFTKKPFLARFYPDFKGRSESPYCQYTSNDIAIYSFMLYPTMIAGTFICGVIMRKLGRPVCIFLCGLFNIIGAIVQITAHTSSILLLGRSLCGLGEGFGMFVYNIFLAEIAPAQLRGKIVGASVIWSATGVTLGQLVNFLMKQREDGWQVAISLIIVPAALLMFNSIFIKDTPTSLLMRGKREEARKSLQAYRGVEDVESELRDLELATINRTSAKDAFVLMRKRQYWPGLIINLVAYTLLNWTGNTAIVYYGPQIFSLLGMGANVALWNACLVGGAKILGVFIGMFLLDKRMTRRTLLTWGGVTQAVFLIATAIVFATSVDNVKGAQVSKGIAALILVMIILYEICFMGGQHVPTLGMAAEVSPIEVRPAIFPINMLSYGTQSMIMSYSFTFQLCAMTWGTFLFMASFAIMLTIWAIWFQPETHHVPIEKVRTVVAAHPVWRRFFPPEDVEEAQRELDGRPPQFQAAVAAITADSSAKTPSSQGSEELK